MTAIPSPDLPTVPAQQGWLTCAALIMVSAVLALSISLNGLLHQDVAFLTWAADQVMRGAIFGRDIYDINPPLSFLIYMPAALLGRVIGFDLAIKLWTVAVASLAMASMWQTAERSIRVPVVAAMGLFFALAFPREFGQREQFAFLLCAPYAAGHAPRRGLAILNGVMAGIGFALKPYFLLPLVLIFLTRRRIRAEEWAIAATGVTYAAIVLLLFQPWLTEFLPKVMGLYWGHNINSMTQILTVVLPVPLFVVVMHWLARPQPGTAGFAMAALGFTFAVIMHRKGFPYHFIPAFGFLALDLAAHLRNERKFVRSAAVLFLIAASIWPGFTAVRWLREAEFRRPIVADLLAEIDKSSSFLVLSNYNFPAFPTAILTHTPYLGLSPTNNFISSVGAIESGVVHQDGQEVGRLAVEQAVRELSRRPDLVIVETQWTDYAALPADFDGLAWLDRQPEFHALWKDYAPAGKIGPYDLYRRR